MSATSRHCSKHLCFTVDNLTRGMVDAFCDDKIDIEDFVAIKPSETQGRYVCYATKKGGSQFNFVKGTVSLAKKMKCGPENLALIHVKHSQTMPDHIFRSLNPNDLDNQIFHAVGQYANKALLKAKVNQALTQSKNKAIVAEITSKGTDACVEEGILSLTQAAAADRYLAKKAKLTEEELRRKKELPRGGSFTFNCVRTGVQYTIVSEKGCGGMSLEEEDDVDAYLAKDVKMLEDGTMNVAMPDEGANIVKRKHYYFYSSGGFGKTPVLEYMLKRLNSAPITDSRNFAGLAEHAQFLVMDEYGPDRKFTLDDLKGLTSGNARGFTGNKKVYGESFRPRSDVQLVIFSNNHLFEVMGKYDPKNRTHKVSEAVADLLVQRFFIFKLDSGDDTTSEQEDADSFTEFKFPQSDFKFLQRDYKFPQGDYNTEPEGMVYDLLEGHPGTKKRTLLDEFTDD